MTTVIPGGSDYSQAWNIHPSAWTPAAIAAGDRVRLSSDSDVVNAVDHGLLVSAGAGPRNEKLKGLRALPGVSNCPVVLELG